MKIFKLLLPMMLLLLLPVLMFGQEDPNLTKAKAHRDEAIKQQRIAEAKAAAGDCAAAQAAANASNDAAYAAGAAANAAYAAVFDNTVFDVSNAAKAAANIADNALADCVEKPQEDPNLTKAKAAQKEAEAQRDEAIKQQGIAEAKAAAGDCAAAKAAADAADAAFAAAMAASDAAGAAKAAALDAALAADFAAAAAATADAADAAASEAASSVSYAKSAADSAKNAAAGCVEKPQEDSNLTKAKAAQKQQGIAEAAAAAGDCAAAKAAADAARAHADAAKAAFDAAWDAQSGGAADIAAFNAAAQAHHDADIAARKAASAAEGCVEKPQEDPNLTKAKAAQKEAEAQRDEAKKQQGIAKAAAKAGDCAAAKAAADAASAAFAAASAASDAAGAASEAALAAALAADFAAAAKADADAAASEAASSVSYANAAASDARSTAQNCNPTSSPASEPVKTRPSMDIAVGGGLGAAQSEATVGYCKKQDGLGKIPQNSTIAPNMNVSMQFNKTIQGGGNTSLDSRRRSPYASFASYAPPSGNAPVMMAPGGKMSLMNLNLGMSYLHLVGKDRHPERNASFDKNMVELLATGDFYVVNLLRAKSATKVPKVSPFVRLGAGFGLGDPKAKNGNMDTKKANFALPMGLGFRVDVSEMVSLNFDYTSRATFGDGLDGIASSTGKKDWYGVGGMGMNFKLSNKDSDGDGFKNDKDQCPAVHGTLNGCPDLDGDGIADREDACPNEAGDLRFKGCPDTDGDGVSDNLDDCPNAAGLRRFSGCPDTDGDNIIDKEDNCPTIAGITAMNGCPDADRDGITDADDACPNDPGPAVNKGCPDIDDDGIDDNKDECPTVPGLIIFNGCPDSDNDGLSDPKDKCPNLKGPVSNDGCPEIAVTDKMVLDEAMRNVKFRTGSAELLPFSKKDLEQIAEVMSRYKGYMLSIDGYTDNQGPVAANHSISEARAKACYDYLSQVGVQLSRMSYTGHGPTKPIADNNTKEGRLKNRRVEFTLVPK